MFDMHKAEQATMPVKTGLIFYKADLRSKGNTTICNTITKELGKIGRRCGFQQEGTHSQRRHKGRIMFEPGVEIEMIANSVLSTTLCYIGLAQDSHDSFSSDFSLDI